MITFWTDGSDVFLTFQEDDSQLTLETSNDCELLSNGNSSFAGRISINEKAECVVELSQCYSVSGELFELQVLCPYCLY